MVSSIPLLPQGSLLPKDDEILDGTHANRAQDQVWPGDDGDAAPAYQQDSSLVTGLTRTQKWCCILLIVVSTVSSLALWISRWYVAQRRALIWICTPKEDQRDDHIRAYLKDMLDGFGGEFYRAFTFIMVETFYTLYNAQGSLSLRGRIVRLIILEFVLIIALNPFFGAILKIQL